MLSPARPSSWVGTGWSTNTATLKPLPSGLLLEIGEALDQSQVLYPVELVDLTTASEAIREKVASEGIPWNA